MGARSYQSADEPTAPRPDGSHAANLAVSAALAPWYPWSAMSPMLGATVLFAVMWIVILYSGYRLYRWLYRLDRANRDGQAPFDTGL